MTNTLKTLVFFGNERLVSGLRTTDTPVLRELIAQGYTIAAVVSHHSDGQSRSNRVLEVAEVARDHAIPVLLPDNPIEIIEQLKQINADAAVLVSYGRIIPQDVIDIFPHGIINIHPSLLPKYRGPTPIESAIANGDEETGVSIMQLTAGMDEGPVYAQATVALSGKETKFDLYITLASLGTELLIDTLPLILEGSIKPKQQDNTHASFSKLLSKSDSLLDTTVHTAEECERLVRAHLGFPKTKLTVLGHDIIITKAHVTLETASLLDIKCSGETILSIDELIAPSGRTMNASAFLNGYAAG